MSLYVYYSLHKPNRYVKANGTQRNGPQITEIDEDFIWLFCQKKLINTFKKKEL